MNIPPQQFYDWNNLDLASMTRCSGDLRRMDTNAGCVKEEANSRWDYLYPSLRGGKSEKHACSFARFFMTCQYHDTYEDLKQIAILNASSDMNLTDSKFLVFLATTGDKMGWNSRRHSRGHQVVPLCFYYR